ncbi:helix-turn-helix domain-containing protein, partial [Nocardia brasiliensis]|uniref:helix-turn-helix domain-containing protein n=1 Tax=Nocardia brasiliensis TaxID=37326 RepID=UPI002458D9C3
MSEGTDSAEVFKALADPTRRVILDELAERDGQTLFELCGRLTMRHGMSSSRQAISQHLEVVAGARRGGARRGGREKLDNMNRQTQGNNTQSRGKG